jgi:predicted RNase H-like nuclease
VLIGVDGCREGWIAVSRADGGADFRWRRVATLADLFRDTLLPTVVAVDIPIGLPGRGARLCDGEARACLGPRRCCVFTPPIRPMLAARTHAQASAVRHRIEGKGVSIQAWAIVPKIREADRLLRRHPAFRAIVREVHPEVCFARLNGGVPLVASKKSETGHRQRVRLLRAWCGDAITRALAARRALGCAADDIVDAFATLWTAERIHRGHATTLPAEPPCDAHGLRMEIVV